MSDRPLCGFVPASSISQSGGVLNAKFYLDPTSAVDKEITVLEAGIARNQERITKLRLEKYEILRNRAVVQGVRLLGSERR